MPDEMMVKDEQDSKDEQAQSPQGAVMTGDVEDAPQGPDDYMSVWGERANAMSDKAWRNAQIAMGIVLGLGCGACLFFLRSEGILPLNFIVALLLSKFGPDFIEKWFERKARTVRFALLISLGAALAAFLVYNLATGGLTGGA